MGNVKHETLNTSNHAMFKYDEVINSIFYDIVKGYSILYCTYRISKIINFIHYMPYVWNIAKSIYLQCETRFRHEHNARDSISSSLWILFQKLFCKLFIIFILLNEIINKNKNTLSCTLKSFDKP